MEKRDTTHMGFVILISVVATIGGFLFGFDSGVINGTVDGLQLAFDLTATQLGTSGPVALVALMVYVAFFNGSWGPIMWVMLGEMFPNQIRGSAIAVAGLAQWMANYAVTATFPVLLISIGLGGAYGFYTVSAFISIFFIIWFVNETKGKELEEMVG